MDEKWEIFHSENSDFYKPCICGHKVKRISYLYNRLSKETMFIGTTCMKKRGIKNRVSNRILIQVLKEEHMMIDKDNLEETITTWVENTYLNIKKKMEWEMNYYDITAPLHRLLYDVNELVSEYNFELTTLLESIKKDVECLDEFTKSDIMDDTNIDNYSISTAVDDIDNISDVSFDETPVSFDDGTAETPVSFDDGTAETPVSFDDSIYSLEHSEYSAETPIEEKDTKKTIPFVIADPFCINYECKFHCYCELRMRIDRLHKDIIADRINIQKIRLEAEEMLKSSKQMRKKILEEIDNTQKFLENRGKMKSS